MLDMLSTISLLLRSRSPYKDTPPFTKEISAKKYIRPRGQICTGAIIWPVEACYQDEFYRCLQEVLGFSPNVSSEWLGDGDGRIDFRLADVAWGIELLRDGDRLHAYCLRFVNNGSYTPWIQKGWLRNWLIIDCRTSPPRPYNVPGTKLWRAVFAEDFSSMEILDASNP
ncbi:hypothetical protein DTO207G8_4651 [Paecilomyces variotii]|nr:hypothetical protein DTO207G8_4651 [Paecilomyces variotii]